MTTATTITAKTPNTVNGYTYQAHIVVIKNTTWEVLVVNGPRSYVSVCKKTANPFGGRMGTDFASFDAATQHYKSAELKLALLRIELGI